MSVSHVPTETTRKQVAIMIGSGMKQQDVCKVVGLALTTLHRHYRAELDSSKARFESQVRGNLLRKALRGDNACMFFWLKTRCGDRERSPVEIDKADDALGSEVREKLAAEATRTLGSLMLRIASDKAKVTDQDG